MAVSLAFGVIFSTVISLMLVPAGYVVLEDIRRLLGATRRRVAGWLLDPAEEPEAVSKRAMVDAAAPSRRIPVHSEN